MAALQTARPTQFIHDFSTQSLSSFFSSSISSFVPRTEKLDYIISDTGYSKFSELTKIGEASFDNSDELIVFSCKYDGPLTERSSRRKQFEIAKKVLKDDFKDGAIFVYHDQYRRFRFSFVRKNYGEKGDKRYSSWKRYTYFVDPADTNKTFRERIGKCTFTDLENIQEAFSVEKLTKDFYNDLFKWFQWTLSEEVGITYPNSVANSDDDRIHLEEQVIRLTTRLLFVWFIKQKELVPGFVFDTNELSHVLKDFDPSSRTEGNYYNAILQNLFFATLNKAVDERDFAKIRHSRDLKTLYRYEEMFAIPQEQVLDRFRGIPFLNGGLFECLDKENIDGNKYYLDGFSRNDRRSANGNFRHRAFIPNCVFFDENNGIIPILERYNFTVEENSPSEVQVALDPELLGNVFENLLGAFNRETQESARKQSGSFYTPREIVSYMVDESLIAYLHNKLPDTDEAVLRDLFEQEPLSEDLQNNPGLCGEVAAALRAVKILDPACGSGAFPMGILNKLVHVLGKLDVDNKESMYDRKLHLIEQCIYGVDIQTIAAQISKLRFFISLVVEQDAMDPDKENYGVLPLPNLETKFVAANTLIAPKRKPAQQRLFENPAIDATKQALLAIRKKHFYARTANAKKQLREQDAELREMLSQLLQEEGDFAWEEAVEFSKWNPYDQNATSPFFDVDWMFGLEEGFDIVIGNPPYFSLSTDSSQTDIKTGKKLKHNKLYEGVGYASFENTGDIYALFYERGWQVLKNEGHLCFITSNKWMRTGYGESARNFFAENTNPILLIDFAGQKIFESATVDTNILLFSKAENKRKTRACVVKEKVLSKLSDYIRTNSSEMVFDNSSGWVILSEIEQRIKAKIEAVGTPLKDWDIRINYGIKTGYNEAFIIDGKKRSELIAEDPKSAEIIRPILRGRDIKRYGYEHSDLWLINTHNGAREHGIKPVDIDGYPAIKKHLDAFYPQLEKRLDKGVTPYHLRNCAYMDDFNRQKIIYSEIVREPQFYLDANGTFFAEATAFILTGEHLDYLYHLLHSKAATYFFKTFYAGGGLGETGYRYKKAFLENLPVPRPNVVIDINKKPDDEVYKLYRLSDEEISFIESQ